jgi:Mg-chelatase subunit ChlD
MNPNESLTPGEELEIRITALLMGELSPEESTALRAQVSDNPELQSLHGRLSRAYDLLRAATPLCETVDPAAPVRLSSERRERLLKRFKATAKREPTIIAIKRPRWTWLAPLSWAASFTIVLGLLAWQLAPREGASWVMFNDSEPAESRPNVMMANPRSYAGYAEQAPQGSALLNLNAPEAAAAGDRLATATDARLEPSRGDEPKLLATLDSSIAPARPAPTGGASGGGGIAGNTPQLNLPGTFPVTPTTPTRVLTRSGSESETLALNGGAVIAGRPVIPELPTDEFQVGQKDSKSESESRRLEVASAAKGKVVREVARRQIYDPSQLSTATEGTFWDKPAADQPAAPAAPTSGPVTNNFGGIAGNGSAFGRKNASDAETKLSETNKQLTAQLEEAKQVADSLKARNSELEKTSESVERALSDLKMAIPAAPLPAGSPNAELADTKLPMPETGAGVPGNLAGRAGGQMDRMKLKSGAESADKETAVAKPYSLGVPLDTAGKVQMETALGEMPVAGSLFKPTQEGQLGRDNAPKGDRAPAPSKPAEMDADIAGVTIEKAEVAGEKPAARGGRAEASVTGGINFARKTDESTAYAVTDPQAEFGFVVPDDQRAKDGAERMPYFRGRAAEETGRSYFETQDELLLHEATDFSGSGRLDLAKKGLEDIATRAGHYVDATTNETRAKLLWQLETKWAEPVRGFTADGELPGLSTTPAQDWYFKQDGTLAKLGSAPQSATPAQQPAEAKEKEAEKPIVLSKEVDAPIAAPKAPAPVPQPEVATSANAFSTFSLNVSDVAFKLTAASLEQGKMPDAAAIRSEEFINAFDYRDPEPAPGAPLAFVAERARYPFAQNRDLLRFSIKTAAVGRQSGRPLNLVLLVDNSGSMERADRVRILRESLRVLAAQLQPQDKLSIITFARTPHLWIDGVPGNEAAQATERVGEITPLGGTNLSAALDLAYETAHKHYQVANVNRVVLLTDGAANLGDVNPAALKQKVETQRKQGIALDCFGVGWEGYNDDLLEQLSRNGDGRYGFINSPDAAVAEFAGQLAGALRVAASDVKVQVEFNPKRVTAYRQIGYAKHQLTKEQFRDNTVDAAEIGAAESGNALYVVEVNPRGEGDLATVRARFKEPGTSDYREHEWTVPFTPNTPALEQASPTMRLAATASAFSEWLAGSPYASEITSDQLLGIINGVPQTFSADPRPQKLEWMIRQAKSLSGR